MSTQDFDVADFARRLAEQWGQGWQLCPDSFPDLPVLRDQTGCAIALTASDHSGQLRVYLQPSWQGGDFERRDRRAPVPEASVRADRDLAALAGELGRRLLPRMSEEFQVINQSRRESDARQAAAHKVECIISAVFGKTHRPGQRIRVGSYGRPVELSIGVLDTDLQPRGRFEITADEENTLALAAFLAQRHDLTAPQEELTRRDAEPDALPPDPVDPRTVIDPDTVEGHAILQLALAIRDFGVTVTIPDQPIKDELRRWLHSIGVDPDADFASTHARLHRARRRWTVIGWREMSTGTLWLTTVVPGDHPAHATVPGYSEPTESAPPGFTRVLHVVTAATAAEAGLAARRADQESTQD